MRNSGIGGTPQLRKLTSRKERLVRAACQRNKEKGGLMKTYGIGIFTLVFLLCSWSSLAHADAVTDWNANAGEAAQAACISPDGDPLHESRIYAMAHIAIHDALNAI